MSVLVVDDDPEIRDLVREYLSEEGFAVQEAADGETMREIIDRYMPNLIILDIKLPGKDGFSLARELRKTHSKVGILMISGKDDLVDRVAGLEVGADDYLVKPFHLRELLARVRSVLRRSEIGESINAQPANRNGGRHDTGSGGPSTAYRFAGWTLDDKRRKLESADGKLVELTAGEFDLLVAFVTHPNRALSRDELLDYARSRESDSCDRSIDVQVRRLRLKIEPDPKRPSLIKTIRNVGYIFGPDVSEGRLGE